MAIMIRTMTRTRIIAMIGTTVTTKKTIGNIMITIRTITIAIMNRIINGAVDMNITHGGTMIGTNMANPV
jgi:hypothetical protein